MHIATRLWPAALIVSGLIMPACTVTTVEAPPPDHETRARRPPPSRPPPPPPSRWEKVAELSVDGKADRDRLKLGRSEGGFRALQFKVLRSRMRMYDITINFTDGSSYSPSTKLVFEPGDTRIVDLPGSIRTIRDIEFRYADMAGGGQAHVEVWGR